jgi:uncharacterized protein YjdB
METFTPTSEDDLTEIEAGKIYQVGKGKENILFVVNTGDSTNTFKVSYGDAASLALKLGVLFSAVLATISL